MMPSINPASAPPAPRWKTDGMLTIPRKAHTYDGFLNWVMADDFPEKLRVTFLDGEVSVDMSEEALQSHIAVKAAIFAVLGMMFQEEDIGEFYPDGVLIGNKSARVSNNPDGAAALWKTILSGRVRFVIRRGKERAVQGSPDWAMEIVSDSSVGKDTLKLRKAYHRAGIREYWLIDARGDKLSFQILHWRKNGYVAAPDQDGWQFSKVFQRFFRLIRSRNRRGAWAYRLEVRSQEG